MRGGKHLKVGKRGEKLAVESIKKNGYKIVEKNAEDKYGEIDIIALKDKKLIFIEVRSKTGEDYGLPEETIGYKKKKRLINNAKRYVNKNKIKTPYQIDVIGIVFNKNGEVIHKKHYKNITI
jgi:putative endonuclease